MFLRFLRLGVFALEIGEGHVQRTRAPSRGSVYPRVFRLTSGLPTIRELMTTSGFVGTMQLVNSQKKSYLIPLKRVPFGLRAVEGVGRLALQCADFILATDRLW